MLRRSMGGGEGEGPWRSRWEGGEGAGRGRARRRKEGWTKEEGKKGRQKRDARDPMELSTDHHLSPHKNKHEAMKKTSLR